MKILRVLLSAAALATAAPLWAHSELPSEEWCASGRPVPVASFEFFPEGLVSDRDGGQSCPAGASDGKAASKECGQFDDDYDRSRRKALAACGAHAGAAAGDIGSVIAVVQAPDTYLHKEHHRLYQSEHGLRGVCVRCERPRPLPIGGLQ